MLRKIEALCMKWEQLTWWRAPSEPIDSEWGRLPYERWCEYEAKRLWQHADVVLNARGQVSLWGERMW